MEPSFVVLTTPRFERLLRAINKQHADIAKHYAEAIAILGIDPYNRTRRYHIKKLEGVNRDAGQYRISLGRWRFRYDISGREIILHYCGLRRENTYR